MLPFNKRSNFDYRRFIEDIKTYEENLPEGSLSPARRISNETGIDYQTMKSIMSGYHIQSFQNILKLASWAGLYLDEYRK